MVQQFSRILERDEPMRDTIITGDSEDVIADMPDESVDLILTSPPYNFGMDYDEHDDKVDWDAYYTKLFAIFRQCNRVLKHGGRIVVNVQPCFSQQMPTHHVISNFFMNEGLLWKGEIIWDKNNYNCAYTTWGSWMSPSAPYLKYTWEFLEVFCKGTIKHAGNKEDADITADEFKRLVVARWNVAPEHKMKEYGHPAMFPEAIAHNVMKLFSYRGDVVLDPFNGVGTTTAVAKRLNRSYIGIDTSEEYCEIARERARCVAPVVTLEDYFV